VAASPEVDLERFVEAQAVNYEDALAELRAGEKRTHWMWYIFPQMRGLGNSAMSQRYSIKTEDEARAYLQHPTLGPRLLECARAAVNIDGRTAKEIFSSPDDMKLRSSATLFAQVSDEPVFQQIIDKYFGGEPDRRTLRILSHSDKTP
jgi:uncharacterized protein (DUF1810 family)